jgi:uncharacterized repeat protein (TIGR03943 family)
MKLFGFVSQSLNFFSPNRDKKSNSIKQWLDVIVFLAWGLLLLKYSLTGELKLLIHPNYFGLVLVTSIVLIILGLTKAILFWRNHSAQVNRNEHLTLFTPGWSSTLLLIIAIAAFIIPPKILSSQTVLQRGVRDTLPLTRAQPQAFRTSTNPEERSLLDWVRTLNAYPEPDAYTGQKAKVTGFVVHLPELPNNYLLISRFVITCCAVDAYPVGIPVKLKQSRTVYPTDTWLQIEGEMMSDTLAINHNTLEATEKQRQLVLVAKKIEQIPTPKDPYDY